MSSMGSMMSRTTAKLGLLVVGFALAVSSTLVAVDPELGLTPRLVTAGMLVLAGVAFMVKALLLETAAPVRHRAMGSGSRE